MALSHLNPTGSPISLSRTKSTVGEAGRQICSVEPHHRDNHLNDIINYYCQGQRALQNNYPLHFDKDLHMKSKLGYANEKAIHKDMLQHNNVVSPSLMYYV